MKTAPLLAATKRSSEDAVRAQPRILYVSASRGADSPRSGPAAIPVHVEWDGPDCPADRAALLGYSAVIVDGDSLGARSIAVAKRIRWLGIESRLFLAWDKAAALDRAIAAECGVEVIPAATLTGRLAALGARAPSIKDAA